MSYGFWNSVSNFDFALTHSHCDRLTLILIQLQIAQCDKVKMADSEGKIEIPKLKYQVYSLCSFKYFKALFGIFLKIFPVFVTSNTLN